MFPLCSNFRQWRENVTKLQNEKQLGCACCSQSGTQPCLCWLTGCLTAALLCHEFLSYTCDMQVMENIHTIHALYFFSFFFQLNMQFICLPCVDEQRTATIKLSGDWQGTECSVQLQIGILMWLNLCLKKIKEINHFYFTVSFGVDCTSNMFGIKHFFW